MSIGSIEKEKADAVMHFVKSIVDSFESGFLDENTLSIAEIYGAARHHVEVNYRASTKSLAEEWGGSLAIECGLNINGESK